MSNETNEQEVNTGLSAERKSQDRMGDIFNVFEAMSDLFSPEPDLHTVDRDKLACAFGFLVSEYREAEARYCEARAQASRRMQS